MILLLLLIWPFAKAPDVTVECSRVTSQDNCVVKSITGIAHRVSFNGVTLITRTTEHPFSTTWELKHVDVDGQKVKVKRK